MDYGDLKDVRWMLATYSSEEIIGVLKKSRGLSRKSGSFWGGPFWRPQRGNRMFAGPLPEKTLALLKKISPLMRDKGFYLAGGSGLALQIGHRISEDLDFFSRRPFEPSSLLRSLKAKVDRLQEILSVASLPLRRSHHLF